MTNREEFVSSIQQVLKKSSATYELRKNIKPIQNVFQCCGATAQTQNRYIQDGLCGPEPLSVSLLRISKLLIIKNWMPTKKQ